ncbi:MAG: ATP-binding protein [Fluviicola sp.]
MQFQDVFGQKTLKAQLIHEINQEKVSHAQLFLGDLGHGGLPMALAFVQYLFCQDRQESDSCGVCDSCQKVKKLVHPDLHFSFPTIQADTKTSNGALKEWREIIQEERYFDLHDWIKFIDKKERTPIIGTEESMEVVKKLSLKSYEGGFKVMLIWKAESMNATYANKILKILEEPPAKTLFILLSESSDALLQTILSRTQVVRIPSLELETVESFLQAQGLSKSQAESISARSNGSIVAAKKLIGDQEEIDLNRELFIELMRVCFKKNVLEMLNWTEKVGVLTKEGQKNFVLYALHMVRQSVLKNYTNGVLSRTSTEEAQFLDKFSRFITNNNLMDFCEIFNDAHYHLDRNANAKLLFTQLCFQVMRFIHKA